MSRARPYALAAFEYAQEHNQLPEWQSFLASAALIVEDSAVKRLLAQPKIASDMVLNLFQGILSLNEEGNNFLRTLQEHQRFSLLPEISNLFNKYYATLEKITPIRVVSAVPMDDLSKEKLSQALSKKLSHAVSMHYEVDPALIGGAIIYIQDQVIDSSIRGKLNRLYQNMIA